MSVSVVRHLLLLISFILGTTACKTRRESDTKDLGAFDAERSAQKGGGRNSFYGTPRNICIYSKFPDNEGKFKEGPPNGDFTPDYLTFMKSACEQRGGHLDGDGTVCLKVLNADSSNQSVQGYIKMVENLNQLASVLDVDVAGRLSLSGLTQLPLASFSLSPAARYYAKMNETDRSVYFVVYVKLDAGSENVLEAAIRPAYMDDLKKAIDKKDSDEMEDVIADFLDDCGDEYSATINYGGEFVGIMEATIRDGVSKSQVYGEVAAQSQLGPKLLGAEVSTNISSEKLNGVLSKIQNVNVFFAQTGGNLDGVRLNGTLDGIQGYQKLIESAENFVRLFQGSGTAGSGSTGIFNGSAEPLNPRPEGSREGTHKAVSPEPKTDDGVDPPNENSGELALDGEGYATPPAEGASTRIKGAIRSANYLNYTEISDVRKLLRAIKLESKNEDDPRNMVESLAIRKDRLNAFLSKYEKIKANYKMLLQLEESNPSLTQNQKNYIAKFKKIFDAWAQDMNMGRKNCLKLGSACRIPEESKNLTALMAAEPVVVLTDFKLPVPVPDPLPPGASRKQIQNGDWTLASRLKSYSAETENQASKTVLTAHTYFEGMRQCRAGWRFPRLEEFASLEKLGFLATARTQYPRVQGQLEKEDGRYNYRCFWRLDPNIKKDAATFPAYATEAQQNGSNSIFTPSWKQCYVVCLDGKIQ